MNKTFAHLLENPHHDIQKNGIKSCYYPSLNIITITPMNLNETSVNTYFKDFHYTRDEKEYRLDLLFGESIIVKMKEINKRVLTDDFIYDMHGDDAIQITNLFVPDDIKVSLRLADNSIKIPLQYKNCTFTAFNPSPFVSINQIVGCVHIPA